MTSGSIRPVVIALVCSSVALLAAGQAIADDADGWGPGTADGTFGLQTEDDGLLSDRGVMLGALELARLCLCGETPDRKGSSELRQFEGRRVFLTVYGTALPAPVVSGKGEQLFESIVRAAEAMREQTGVDWVTVPPASFRIRLDIVDGVSTAQLEPGVHCPSREGIGAWGILIERASGEVTYVTPAEVVELDLFHQMKRGLPTYKLIQVLGQRAASGIPVQEDASYSRFTARSYIEGPAGEGIVELLRNHVIPNDPVDLRSLSTSARAAADYLARSVDDKGKFDYKYTASTGRSSYAYNMLRHAGTSYSLAQAYSRFRDPAYMQATERSLDYLLARTELRDDPGRWGPDYRFITEDRKAKLGGSALALLAMCEYTEATGDRRYLGAMREFARFIVRMQDEDSGKLASYFDYGPTAEVPAADSIYYPGESVYALSRLYILDPDPLWLEVATRAARWLIVERDGDLEPGEVPHDHWLMVALSYLHLLTGEEMYLDQGRAIVFAIESRFRTPDDPTVLQYPDYVGTYYLTARTTPVACRIEALVAAVDLFRQADEDAGPLLEMALLSASFPMTLQFDPVNSFYLPDPDRALGGIREGVYENAIRIDFVEHALSGLLGVERLLAAEEGIALPGGAAWSRGRADGSVTFEGYLPPDQTEAEAFPGDLLHHIPSTGRTAGGGDVE